MSASGGDAVNNVVSSVNVNSINFHQGADFCQISLANS